MAVLYIEKGTEKETLQRLMKLSVPGRADLFCELMQTTEEVGTLLEMLILVVSDSERAMSAAMFMNSLYVRTEAGRAELGDQRSGEKFGNKKFADLMYPELNAHPGFKAVIYAIATLAKHELEPLPK